jgi:autotransporter translocation and assembly factor TamB
MDFEGDLSLKGSFPSPLLSGRMLILDGRYTKDFNLLDALISEPKKKGIATTGAKTGAAEVFNPRLDLNVKSNGDMEIRNNVGRIWLRINTDVRGTWEKPTIAGSINTEDGIVDYLGLKFDITKGFVELREKYSEPYLEVHAEKELGVHNINLVLYGPIDNLALDLSATSPSGLLEKRDVVSLILFGITEQERQLAANQGGSDQTSALISSSISGLMERPITQFTGLDLFRLEASETDSRGGSKPFSRLYIGKDISDRLSVKFSTDIDSNESIQTIIAEYLLTDHFLVRGARSTDFSSEISGIVRFRLR